MRKVRVNRYAPLGGIEFSRANAVGSIAGLAADADAAGVGAQATRLYVI